MRDGLSGAAATVAARGADAFAEGARTNLMIFFSFAFIPSPHSVVLTPSSARSAPLSRGCRLLPLAAVTGPACGGWRGRARAVRIPVTNAAVARGVPGGSGAGGRTGPGRPGVRGDPLSLIKLYEYAILLSRFLPPSSLLLVMFLSCL